MPHHSSSFPRRRESSEKTFLVRSFVAYWIPVPAQLHTGTSFHGNDKGGTGRVGDKGDGLKVRPRSGGGSIKNELPLHCDAVLAGAAQDRQNTPQRNRRIRGELAQAAELQGLR